MPDYGARIERLAELLGRERIDACFLLPGATFAYCTGRHIMLDAVTTLGIFFGADTDLRRKPLFLVPSFELRTFESLLQVDADVVPYDRNPAAYASAVASVISELGLGGRRIGVDSGSMRYREIAAIQSVRPRVELHPVEAALEPLRLCKDDGEVACIRRAIRITESAMESTLNRIQAGMTEKDVCRLIEIESLRGGADGMAFEPIVVSGPRSALQHVAPSLRELKAGDCVILDVGACSDGYRADITRTLSIGSPDQVTERAHAVVLEANQAASSALRPGVSAGSVDGAARAVIDSSEFRGRLIHGVGHGLGLDIHEPPIVASGASTMLEPGMVFTVEPGIYLEGQMGVRVEDVVIVTATGSEYLTTISRDLRVL